MSLDVLLQSATLKDLITILTSSSYSLIRMMLGMVLSYAFSIIYGIVAARNKRAEKVLIPVLDILQSVPILGFFPAAIFFFIALFQQSSLGVEIAAVFLIFTSQAWNLAFAVYESVGSIPAELEEASYAFGLKGWKKFKTLYLPASVLRLVYNGVLSWSAGWYFLVAAEMISIGSKQYVLNGIGSYLANATYSGDYKGTVLGLATLVIIILFVDVILWMPLRSYANRFKYETVLSDEATLKELHDPRFAWLRSHLAFRAARQTGLAHVITTNKFRPVVETIRHATEEPKIIKKHHRILFIAIGVVILVGLVLASESNSGLVSFPESFANDLKKPEIAAAAALIPSSVGYSILRLLAAYLLSIAWVLPLSLALTGKPRSFNKLVVVMEILASLPATALFPLIISGTINLPGGLELTSIILTMTGMQWYLLFNVFGGIRAIPSDLTEVAKAYNLKGFEKFKRFIFPAILPTFITGSITGWGGGWNALILSEYVVYNQQTLTVPGIGGLMSVASYQLGNVSLLFLTIIAMSTVVVVLNRTIWRRLYKIIFSKYKLDY